MSRRELHTKKRTIPMEVEICQCPECKEILVAPKGYDPLKRGCFICGWNQE